MSAPPSTATDGVAADSGIGGPATVDPGAAGAGVAVPGGTWKPTAPAVGDAAAPRRFGTLGEIALAARAGMDPKVWDFLEGGAGEEQTLDANRRAFLRWSFRPRLLNGIGVPDTATTFLGVPLRMPILTAPFGAEGQFHPEGHLAVARANAAAGVASIVPEASTFPLERIAAEAPSAARIMQLHPTGRPENVLAMVRRAAAAGYTALCVTCDCPTAGWRERNMRNAFEIDERFVSGNYPAGSPVPLQEVFGQLFRRDEPLWTWRQVGDLMAEGGLPWMAKGVLTREDAIAAAESGASAVLVSNHGGRQLDGAPAALDQLPEVVAALTGRPVQVALDSGVRRGSDVVKALALGADVVVLGRATALGLAADGEAGVALVHALMAEELVTIMTLTGRASLADIGRDLLQAA
ncbi:alpha-hydroxy acid oxidase [Patulibacter sp. NPDC049589]|uniref:alpha-hydroxy acid oxidase n=1 Tax=Patulibacter sp. NPDC049589 TaxID=3154731 RepID=UPI0034337055